MSAWLIGMLAASPVVLHLAESTNLPPDHPHELILAMAAGVERATEKKVVIPDLSKCEVEARCLQELGAQYAASDVVLVKLVGAVRTARAMVSVGTVAQGILRRVDLEYPLGAKEDWPAMFGGLAAILFPTELKKVELAAVVPPPPVEEQSIVGPVLSWTSIGTGAALGIAAIALRVDANSIRNDVEGRTLDDPMRGDLIDDANARGLASNLLFGVGAVAVVSGAVYLLTR